MKTSRPCQADAVSGAKLFEIGGLKNIICQNAPMMVGTAKAKIPPKNTSQGVISMRLRGWVPHWRGAPR